MIRIRKRIETSTGDSEGEALLNPDEISSVSDCSSCRGVKTIIKMHNGETIHSYNSVTEIDYKIASENLKRGN